jgi:dipeptidyl aminopeptidase/acylaminoacyl peptidase
LEDYSAIPGGLAKTLIPYGSMVVMPTHRVMRWIGLGLLTLVASTPPLTAIDIPPRPPRIDDRFDREVLQFFAFAPDGQALAFVRGRPASSQLTNGLQIPEVRNDVWVQEDLGRPARNLTDGASDASGWWAPQWSPSGKRLAFLSSRGGNVALWVWDRGTTRVRQASAEGVVFDHKPPYCWIDDQRILALVMREGERASPLGNGGQEVGKGVELASAAWAKAARGEVTARPIHSLKMQHARRRVALIDLARGSTRVLATTQVETQAGQESSWWPSPDGQAIAVRRVSTLQFSLVPRWRTGFPASLDLIGLDGERIPLKQPLPENIVTSTLMWSPDGSALAFFALGDALIHPDLVYGDAARDIEYPAVASTEYPGRVWRVDVRRGLVEPVATGDVDLGTGATPPPFMWTATGELLFRAPRLVNGARPVAKTPSEWLVLGPEGRVRPVAKDAARLPTALQSIAGGSTLLGLLDGDVWAIDVADGAIRNLTHGIEPQIASYQIGNSKAPARLLVTAVDAPKTDADRQRLRIAASGLVSNPGVDFVVDMRTGESTPLVRPAPGARAVAFSPQSGQAILLKSSWQHGTFAWRTGTGREKATAPLSEINTGLRRIAPAEGRMIQYTGLNGQTLKARITLPYGYQAGRRYPLVVDSDTGLTPTSSPLAFEETPDDGRHPLPDGDIFAAAGYMYMRASMPTDGMDRVGRANLLSFTDGILPAVDRAIALGLADPDRLLLFGSSSMGNAALGLITQTSRFRAAVAAFCWSDQIVNALEMDFVRRYTESAFDYSPIGAWYSDSQLPFWRNGEHYRRNSPLTYVDRVRTPVMIVAGEMDAVPLASAEMFFAALLQQRKPALFVHYWAEGHGLRTPANARDYWRRMFAWFDEHGDITRDAKGTLVFEQDRVKSRGGRPPLDPDDFARFGPAVHVQPATAGSEPQP